MKMINSIERYNIELNYWTMLEDIQTPSKMCNSICMSLNNQYIIVFGGARLSETTSTDQSSIEPNIPIVDNRIHLLSLGKQMSTPTQDILCGGDQFEMVHKWVT
jgi:hypothetical protein